MVLGCRIVSKKSSNAVYFIGRCLVGVGIVFYQPLGFAWSEHSLITFPILNSMDEIKGQQPVVVESLADFVNTEAAGLALLLQKDELWLRNNYPYYLPRPEQLKFTIQGNKSEKLQAFVKALRINPETRLQPYLQLLPGQGLAGRTRLASKAIAVYNDLSYYDKVTFVGLNAGERVAPIAVLVTANDEPDNGLDIGLFSDNQTEIGKQYGFGPQSFGDPNLDYGSQAPFHMGFYHESEVLFTLAPFLRITFPDYRVHQFKKLAEFAFATGHDYWGWRFMGWGMHYVGDISQPYHSRLQPGISTWSSMWINAKHVVGLPQSQEDAIQLLSNRHLAIENIQQALARAAYVNKDFSSPIFKALTKNIAVPAYSEFSFSQVFAKQSFDKSDELAELLERWLPYQLVSDPSFELSNAEEAGRLLELVKAQFGDVGIQALTLFIADLMADHNANVRSYSSAILTDESGDE